MLVFAVFRNPQTDGGGGTVVVDVSGGDDRHNGGYTPRCYDLGLMERWNTVRGGVEEASRGGGKGS